MSGALSRRAAIVAAGAAAAVAAAPAARTRPAADLVGRFPDPARMGDEDLERHLWATMIYLRDVGHEHGRRPALKDRPMPRSMPVWRAIR